MGIGRAFGEATAVAMVAGNKMFGPTVNVFDTTRTLTTTMLAGLKEKMCIRDRGHMAAIEDTVILQKNKTKTYILTFADSSQTQRFLQERLQMKQISELCVHVYVREDRCV